MEPRAIAPQDIHVGDIVAARRVDRRVEGVVTQVGDMYIYIGRVQPVAARTSEWSFTLLDHSDPPREGGVWKDPVTHINYGCIRDGKGLQYLPFPGFVKSRTADVLSDLDYRDRLVIARLVPLDSAR